MEQLSNISNIKNILGKHGFTFSKALGQNFLINPSVCPRMAAESGAEKNIGVMINRSLLTEITLSESR